MMKRKSRKTARAIFVNAWANSMSNYVAIVDDDYNHRTYYRVTLSSIRRAQRAQLALMAKGNES